MAELWFACCSCCMNWPRSVQLSLVHSVIWPSVCCPRLHFQTAPLSWGRIWHMSVCHQANTPFTRTFSIHSLPNTCVCVVLRVLRSAFSCLSLMISAVQYWSIFCPPVSVLRWTQRTLSDHRSPENVTKKLLLQCRSASEETFKKSSGVVFQRVYCVFSSIKSSRWRHRNEPELSAPLVLYSWTSWGVSTGSF